MKRKNLILLTLSFVCVAVMTLFSACKKENGTEPEDPTTPQTQPQQTLVSDKARPSWNAPQEYDYTSSMTAIVRVDLKAQYPELAKDFKLTENDLLAAFSGTTCLGTATPSEEDLFFLYVVSTEGNVTLRYYSGQYKNIFEAKDAFPYRNDTQLGNVAEPFVPAFKVAQ